MNLKEMFGSMYVVSMDESWKAESEENRTEFRAKGEEKYYYEIAGKYGVVYPYSDTVAAVRLAPRVGRKLQEALGSELSLFENNEEALAFRTPAKNLKVLLKFIRPRRVWQVSNLQKAIGARRLAAYRFRKGELPHKFEGSEPNLAAISGAVDLNTSRTPAASLIPDSYADAAVESAPAEVCHADE